MWHRYKVVLVFSSDCSGSSSKVCSWSWSWSCSSSCSCSRSLLSSAALQSSNCCTVLISSLVNESPSSLSSADGCSSLPLIHSSSFCSSCSSLICEGPGSSSHTPELHSSCFEVTSSMGVGTVGCLASVKIESKNHYTCRTQCTNQRKILIHTNQSFTFEVSLEQLPQNHFSFKKGQISESCETGLHY